MKKFGMMLVVALSLAFASCGGDDNNGGNNNSGDNNGGDNNGGDNNGGNNNGGDNNGGDNNGGNNNGGDNNSGDNNSGDNNGGNNNGGNNNGGNNNGGIFEGKNACEQAANLVKNAEKNYCRNKSGICECILQDKNFGGPGGTCVDFNIETPECTGSKLEESNICLNNSTDCAECMLLGLRAHYEGYSSVPDTLVEKCETLF